MKLKFIIIVFVLGYNIIYAQSKLTEEYIRNCLPFKIHAIDHLQIIKNDLSQKSHNVYITVYSDPSNHTKIVFRGGKRDESNYYVILSTEYNLPDSIFTYVCKNFIKCVINDKEKAIEWFDVIIKTILKYPAKYVNVTKSFGHVMINIQTYTKNISIGVDFIQEPIRTIHFNSSGKLKTN